MSPRELLASLPGWATPGPWRVQTAACDHDDETHSAIKGGGYLVVNCVESEADAALIAAAPALRDALAAVLAENERQVRDAYRAGLDAAAKLADDRATTREATAEQMHESREYRDATTYRTYATAERALAGAIRALAKNS